MMVTLRIQGLQTPGQVRAFLEGSRSFDFKAPACEAAIFNGHLYNLGGSRTYQGERGSVSESSLVEINIGERRKPRPESRAPRRIKTRSAPETTLRAEPT